MLLNPGPLDWESSALTTRPHPEESVLKPTRSLTYLDFIINSTDMTLKLIEKKKQKIYDLYTKIFEKSKPTIPLCH